MRYYSIIIALPLLASLLISQALRGQGTQGSGSPYSAYGLGDIMGSTQVSQAMMGVEGVALLDPLSVIRANPASYVSLRSPVFETGLVTRSIQYDLRDVRTHGRRTDLLGLTIGVPVGRGSIIQGASQPANRWGLALGVNPVTRVGYSISDMRVNPSGGGDARLEYSGDGGLNRAFIGIGVNVWQNNDTINRGSRLAIGANFDYVFGNIETARKAYFPQSTNNYNTQVSSRLIVRAPTASVGIQWSGDLVPVGTVAARMQRKAAAAAEASTTSGQVRIPESLRYTIGVSAEMPAAYGVQLTELVNSFAVGSSGIEFNYDTISFRDGIKGRAELPMLLRAGFSIYNSRWMVTAEHRRRQWSGYQMVIEGDEMPAGLADQSVFALGGSYRPAGDRSGNIWRRAIYRAGVRYSDDYRIVAGTQLQEIGIGFGMALPVMSSTTRSRVSVGLELSERGAPGDGLLKERAASVFVGFTITPDVREQWFRKRRLE